MIREIYVKAANTARPVKNSVQRRRFSAVAHGTADLTNTANDNSLTHNRRLTATRPCILMQRWGGRRFSSPSHPIAISGRLTSSASSQAHLQRLLSHQLPETNNNNLNNQQNKNKFFQNSVCCESTSRVNERLQLNTAIGTNSIQEFPTEIGAATSATVVSEPVSACPPVFTTHSQQSNTVAGHRTSIMVSLRAASFLLPLYGLHYLVFAYRLDTT